MRNFNNSRRPSNFRGGSSQGSSSQGGYSRGGNSRGGYSRGGSFRGRNSQGGNSRGNSFGGGSGSKYRRGTKKTGFAFNESMFIKAAESVEEKPYIPTFKFSELEVDPILKENILRKGYDNPTPIQNDSIKNIMEGKDLLGIADTGTGKTAAFLIPLVDKVINNPHSKTLIITPTRELADQINQELFFLTRNLGIYSVLCIGGAYMSNQIYNLRKGYNFVIGTPGRLKDLFDRKVLNLNGFDTIVLDEVDRMLDMGFVHEIKHLISFLPKEKQSLCFSATIDKKVEEIINELLKPEYIKISIKTGVTAKNIEQNIIRAKTREEKIFELEELLKSDQFDKILIFVNTKREVDKLDKHLYGRGFRVTSIHGERRQNERKRSIESFKTGKAKILIATDVAARGLDINNISLVVNYDIPMNYEDYIHRVGRTGRANKKGMALTFVG